MSNPIDDLASFPYLKENPLASQNIHLPFSAPLFRSRLSVEVVLQTNKQTNKRTNSHY